MLKTTRTLWLLSFLAGTGALTAGCATLGQYNQYTNMDKPGVSLVNIQLAESTLLEQRFVIDLRLTNPNNFALPVSGLSYDLQLNGMKFATGGSSGDLALPALGEKLVSVTLSTSAFDWYKQYRQMRKQGGAALDSMKYQLKGKLFVDGLAIKSIPFTKDGDIGLSGKQ